MKIVYLDLLFLGNLLADYLLCLTAARLCSFRLRRGRYLLAALLGALYGTACLLPALRILAAPPGLGAALLAMGLIAYGGEARPLRGVLTLAAVTAAFGGALYALSLMAGAPPRLSLRLLAVSFLLCYGVLKLLSRFRARWDGSKKTQIRLVFCEREAFFSALVDSGNTLRDPATGAAVLIVSPAALRPVFREYAAAAEGLDPVELVSFLGSRPPFAGRLRLISFRSLGGGGLLPVFRPDRLEIDGRPVTDLLTALSPAARGDGFEAIL